MVFQEAWLVEGLVFLGLLSSSPAYLLRGMLCYLQCSGCLFLVGAAARFGAAASASCTLLGKVATRVAGHGALQNGKTQHSVTRLIAEFANDNDNTCLPTLYLVRHGQASFGAADYDNLSDLGAKQSIALGEYFKAKNIRFDAAYMGSLKRHAQTYSGIAQGLGSSELARTRPGLNEYDSDAVLQAIHPEPLSAERTPENYRKHFRLLRDGLAAWMAGTSAPKGMPTYPDFVRGITDVLDEVRAEFGGKEDTRILICSSGGPISTAVGHILGTSPQATIELNLRIRNSSVTEFAFTPKRHMLVTYNTLPHLEDKPELVTYA